MHVIPYRSVRFTGGYWQWRQQCNREITLPAVYERFRETGRFAALECNPEYAPGQKPHIFWDSDIAKWIESTAYCLQEKRDPALEKLVDDAVAALLRNQWADGYINSYFTAIDPENRFVNRDWHELYCAGHLMEAAAAYYEVTGKDAFLRAMCKYADYIEQVFFVQDNAEFGTCGHEEIELALIRLYHCTEQERYLHLSQAFVERRGRDARDADFQEQYWAHASYNQSHLPVREQKTAEGHSVRALYLFCAMADIALETKDDSLLDACETLFDNITEKRMYITGGIGSSHIGEAFTIDYDLPNATAYAETCAAIALVLFSRRMYALRADGRYADTAERALYNGVLSGLSLDGRSFFYENPLEVNPALHGRDRSVKNNKTRYPILRRKEVFDCSCCPPNLTRLIASWGDFFYTHTEDTLFIHHYAQSEATFQIAERAVSVTQETNYPLDGAVFLRIEGMQGKTAALRIPGWCEQFALLTDGAELPLKPVRGYVYLPCETPLVTLELRLGMSPRLWQANPAVQENAGRAALTRGPLVYCLEQADNGALLRSLAVDTTLDCTLEYDETIHAPVIHAPGWRYKAPGDALYAPYANDWQPQKLTFIPYYAFANRSEGEMLAWVQVRH